MNDKHQFVHGLKPICSRSILRVRVAVMLGAVLVRFLTVTVSNFCTELSLLGVLRETLKDANRKYACELLGFALRVDAVGNPLRQRGHSVE